VCSGSDVGASEGLGGLPLGAWEAPCSPMQSPPCSLAQQQRPSPPRRRTSLVSIVNALVRRICDRSAAPRQMGRWACEGHRGCRLRGPIARGSADGSTLENADLFEPHTTRDSSFWGRDGVRDGPTYLILVCGGPHGVHGVVLLQPQKWYQDRPARPAPLHLGSPIVAELKSRRGGAGAPPGSRG
jgi:hypothetical protein